MASKFLSFFNRSREIHGQATDDGETSLTIELNEQLQLTRDELDHEKERAKKLEGQLQLTQDKLHREQDRARYLEVDYHKEAKELREFKVTANLLEEDQTKLKGELASLKDTCQRQKAELQQYKGQLDDLVGQLQQAKDQLHVDQERARHLEDDKLMIKRNWTETEGVAANLRLQNEALQQQCDSALSEYNKLERKYIQLNKENERLCRPTAGKPDNEHFRQPVPFSPHTNQQI
ncbi:coiled-coil domain-containing protein 186-like [Dysidea avara]|uniref:coiled-coil domain-containing protein 186-like n=1 Tax=Dysidea avara TaxID=196820 RepID=UPI00331FF731